MNTIVQNHSSASVLRPALLYRLLGVAGELRRRRQDARDYRHLETLPDYLLRDIGLKRVGGPIRHDVDRIARP